MQVAWFPKRRGIASTRGQDYEVALCCLLFLRALRHASDFFLASNHNLAGSFDDVVLYYKLKGDQDNGYRAILLQAKHRENCTQQKLTLSYPFRLKEYLESFKKIRNLWEQSVKVKHQEIQLNEIILVLYTNTGCVFCDAAVDVTNFPETQHLQDLLNTGGRLLQISEALGVKLSQEKETSEFLSHLLLCTEQMNVQMADQFLAEELCIVLKLSSLDIASKFKTELKCVVKTWWGEEGTGHYLTAESTEWKKVLERQVSRLNGDTLNIDSRLNLDFTESALQELRVVHRHMKMSWICVRDEYQANTVRMRLFRAQGNALIVTVKSLEYNLEEVNTLWGNNICPVLVLDMSKDSQEECSLMLQHLQEAVQSDEGKQLVVITKGMPANVGWRHVDTMPTWSALHQVTQDRLLSTRVRLQGKAMVLRDIVGSHVSDIMTDRVINSLCECETEMKLGAAVPMPLEFYVPRCLERTSSKTITVDTLINTNTLLFSHTDMSLNNEFRKRFRTLYQFEIDTIKAIKYPTIMKGIYNDYDIRELCLRFCVKCISGEFSMKDSHGSVKEFIPFTWNCEEKIIIIEGPPGVGKSSFVTMMCSRVKEQFPESWVLRLDMGQYTDYIKDTDFTETKNIKEFLLRCLPKDSNNLEWKLLEHSLSVAGNIFLFLDAFDEISPNFTTKCNELLKHIAQTIRYRQMVVTTRPATLKNVEEVLKTEAFTLPVFSEEEQNLFLKKFSEAKGKKVSEEEISSLHQSAGTILEIPLLCKMAADLLLHHQEQLFLKCPIPWRRVLLYKIFVEQIVQNQLAEKFGLEFSVPGVNKLLEYSSQLHLQNLQELAVRKLMPVDQLPPLSISMVTPEEKLGLIVNTGDRVEFEHQTFAEYFLGCWLACHWQQCPRQVLRNILFQDGFQFVASTLNWLLFDGLPLHMAVAQGDKDTVRALVSAGTTDRGGRTALHVAAMTQGNHREVWEMLLTSYYELNKKDDVLGTTAIRYAEYSANWEFVNVFLEKGGVKHNIVGNTAMKVLTYLGLKKQANIGDQKLFKEQEAVKEVLVYAVKKNLLTLFQFIWRRHSNICQNESLLHIAAANNSKDVMKVIIEMLNEINMINENGFTPLHEGSRNGHVEAVTLLVQSGADLNINNEDGDTALILAARGGHLEVVKILLENGADLNIKTVHGHTALALAAFRGNVDVVKILLQNKADLNMKAVFGMTELALAASGGHVDVMKMLLQNRAVLNAKTENDHTVLMEAACGGHLEAVQILLENEADLNIMTEDGYTALALAACRGHVDVVKILLQNGADLNMKKDRYGVTALVLAAYEGHQAVVKLLLENIVNFNIKAEDGCIALVRAALKGHLDVVKLLLENIAYLNINTEDGNAALTCAAIRGHLEVVKILIENIADFNIGTEKDHAALPCAASEGHVEVVKVLLENGADLNIKIEDSHTALACAASRGHLEVVKVLLENGADLNIKTEDGDTALTKAAVGGHLEVIKVLLENGADPETKNFKGESVLILADKGHHLEVASFLMELKQTREEG